MSEKEDLTDHAETFKKKVMIGLVTITIILATLYLLIRVYR